MDFLANPGLPRIIIAAHIHTITYSPGNDVKSKSGWLMNSAVLTIFYLDYFAGTGANLPVRPRKNQFSGMKEQDTGTRKTRKRAAILFIDIEGYTAMMHADEDRAISVIQRFNQVVHVSTGLVGGHIIQFYGDACLITFDTADMAARCAHDMQRQFLEGTPVPVRMGMHIGDVWSSEDNIYGDAVNIASRIENMGVPGSILLSAKMSRQIPGSEFRTKRLGKFHFKNLPRPIIVHALDAPGILVPRRQDLRKGQDTQEGTGKLARLLLPLAAALMIFIVYAGSTGTWPFNATDESKPVIAFYPTTNQEGMPGIKESGYPVSLAEKLSYTPGLITIWPSDLSDARKLMSKAQLFPAGDETAFLELLGVTHFIRVDFNDGVRIKLFEVRRENPVWTSEQYAENKGSGEAQAVYLNLIRQLGLKPGPAFLVEANQARDPEVMDLFKRALYFWHDRQNENSYFEAISLLEEAWQIDSTDDKVNGLLSMAYQTGIEREYYSAIEEDDIEEMIYKHAGLALESSPEQPYALIAKGSNAYFHGNYTSAHQYLMEAHQTAPDLGLTTQALADFSLYTGDYANALTYIRQANAALPGDKTILRYLSWCLMSNGEIEASVANTERMILIYPEMKKRNYYRWAYSLVMQDYDQALTQIPASISPAFRSLMEGIIYLDAGQQENFEAAMGLLRGAVAAQCRKLGAKLPGDRFPDQRATIFSFASALYDNPDRFCADLGQLTKMIEQHFLTDENAEELQSITMQLEGLHSAYNSLMLLHHVHDGSANEKADARKYYRDLMDSGERLPIHWLVQTYPFACFNSLRTDPGIRQIAAQFGIHFGQHPWFDTQNEAG